LADTTLIHAEDKASKASAAENFDEVLEGWQTMLDEGDYEGVMSQMWLPS
jgi:hypothetical protein